MKKSFYLFPVLFCIFSGAAQNCDSSGTCKLPESPRLVSQLRVLTPVGKNEKDFIRQAPRLDTLNGKRIAIVGGSFMASVTHPEIKRLILQHFPQAKVYVLREIGSAGPWPGPGVIRPQKDKFVQNLKSFKIDAVISGNGGCGLCTPREMGSCIAAEYAGLPSVMIAAPGFSLQAKRAARIAGVPVPRVAEYPGAFASHSREKLLENTRNILWPQILTALTTPISGKEIKEAAGILPENGPLFTGSREEIDHFFSQNGWTDGLPFIPPTQEKVNAFLKYTALAPSAIIGAIPPSYRKATVQLVAVNGVMSGCPPEFMPLLIAFTRAMTDGDFRRTLASTHAWTPYCWISGPIARQLGLESGQGAISYSRNAKIGRFINLAMLNLGGYHIKENRMGTFGYLMPWCLAEDEQAAVKLNWRPWHMQQGYALNDNVLTAGSSLNWGNNLSPATADPQKVMELIAQDAVEKQQFSLGSGTPCVYRTILITEHTAQVLAKKYKSKEALEKALISTARQPVSARAYANYWANPGSSFNTNTYSLRRHTFRIRRKENAENTLIPPWLTWTGIRYTDTVPVMAPGKTALLITGDPNRNKTMCIPGGGYAAVRIELPANWDQLMTKAGYAPLRTFYLRSALTPSPYPQMHKNYRRKKRRAF